MAEAGLDNCHEKERAEQSTEDSELWIGKKFDTADDLFKAYKAYAKRVGFAVRKRTLRKNELGIIRSLTYVCSQQGRLVSLAKSSTEPPKSKRCECKAYVTARLNSEDKLEISQLALDHNHPIRPSKENHCSRVDMEEAGVDDCHENERGEQNTEDSELYIGEMFDTSDDLFEAYKAYAERVGFAITKRTFRRNQSGIIRSLTYVCSRHGNPINGGKNPTKPQKSKRCQCKAYVTARLNDEDKWEISQLALDHNHPTSLSKSPHYHKDKVSSSCLEWDESSLRYNQMCMKFCEVADLASGSDEQCKVVNEWLDDKIKELRDMSVELEKLEADKEVQGDTSTSKVCDPIHRKRKGQPRFARFEAMTKKKPSDKPNQEVINTGTSESVPIIPTPSIVPTPSTVPIPLTVPTRTFQGTYMRAPRGTYMRPPRGSYLNAPRAHVAIPHMAAPSGMIMIAPLARPHMDALPSTMYTIAPPVTTGTSSDNGIMQRVSFLERLLGIQTPKI